MKCTAPLDSARIQEILTDRFGHDCLIALATLHQEQAGKIQEPNVRIVDAWYDHGSFFLITSPKSHKVVEIQDHPHVSIAASWFTASGTARIQENFSHNPESKQKIHSILDWFEFDDRSFEYPYELLIEIELEKGVLVVEDHQIPLVFLQGIPRIEPVEIEVVPDHLSDS